MLDAMQQQEKETQNKVRAKLPLNQAVTVTFTPQKSGKLKYGCAMQKMIGGVITVI